jgi:serine O-acetyltransferase
MASNLARDLARLRHKSAGRFPKYAIEAVLFDNGFQAVLFYRLARWFKVRRVPFFGPFFARLGLFLTGADLSPSADIGPGLRISHGVGIVVGGRVRIGANCLLLHGVTLGSVSEERVGEMPAIGDRVFLGAAAMVLGPVTVGDDALLGAGVLVTRDVPAGARVLRAADAPVLPSAAGGRHAPPVAPRPAESGGEP